jgi:hypothetical protein
MSSSHVIVANDLRTGRVVYLGRKGKWLQHLSGAEVFSDNETLETALDAAITSERNNYVIAPEAVAIDPALREPAHYREQIRSNGPTCVPPLPALQRSA